MASWLVRSSPEQGNGLRPGGVEILLAASCYRFAGDKLQHPRLHFHFFFNNTSLAPYSCFKTKDFSHECETKMYWYR